MANLGMVERDKVVFFLGYPTKILRDNSTHFNRILNNRFDNLSDETISRIHDILAKIDIVRETLDNTQHRGHVAAIDEIQLDTNRAVYFANRQYMRYIKELSSILDIDIRQSTAPGVGMVGIRT